LSSTKNYMEPTIRQLASCRGAARGGARARVTGEPREEARGVNVARDVGSWVQANHARCRARDVDLEVLLAHTAGVWKTDNGASNREYGRKS